MCTAATYKTKDFYFGRTLDNGFSYGDEVTVMPRNYPLRFLEMGQRKTHYAMIGMACAVESYPLYYDAVNEKGVGMAGLNFVGNAVYRKREEGKDNIAQFELIPWILCQCATVGEAREFLPRINITNIPFNDKLPLAQLHWILADKKESVVIESVEAGLRIYDNPVGVLTNNPPFDMQMAALRNYMAVGAAAEKYLCAGTYPGRVQLWHGSNWPSGRFIVAVEIRQGGVYQNEFRFRGWRKGKRQPVFSYSEFRRPAEGLLQA